MLLGYSFEPRPNRRALGTEGSVLTFRFTAFSHDVTAAILGSLSKDVFERRTSSRSEVFYFGGARSKGFATPRNVPKLLFWGQD